MKIRTKLSIGFVLIIGLFVGVQSYQYHLIDEISSVSEYHDKMSIPALTILEQISTNFEMMHGSTHSYALKHSKEVYEQDKQNILNLITQYEKLIYAKDSSENYFADPMMQKSMQAYVEQMLIQINEYDAISVNLFQSIDDDSLIDLEKNFGLLDEKAQLFRNILAEDKSMELEGTNQQQQIIESASDTISNSFLLGNAFLGISSIVIITVISFSINKQLSSLKEVARKLSLGNYDVKIPSLNDEFEPLRLDIGILAKTIDKNLSELQNFKNALDKSASVVITDPDGTITYANDAFSKLTKYSKNEMIGKTHHLIKSGHHESEFYEDLWSTITSGKVWIGEIKNKTKDGNYNWSRTMIMPVLDDHNKIIEYIEIRTDITSQIELREKLLKNEKLVTIGELSARLAHDIRNPLSIIQVSLENLKLMAVGKDIDKKHFDRVERAISRISHQIEDVLSFIRKEPMRFEKSRISEIIADALDSINLPDSVYFEISKNDFEFYCDKKRLPVALTNLILNSIQSITGKGTIKIDCEENDDNVVITIEDSGKGIPTNMMEDIFEPLFTTKQQGTGLGLASVKSIIQGHGGTISVTSPPTIFTIILPKNPHSSK